MDHKLYGAFLKTQDSAKLGKFYVEKLGFKQHHSCDGCVVVQAPGGEWLMIQKNPSVTPQQSEQFSMALCFKVGDLKALHAKLSKDGVTFKGRPEPMKWGALSVVALDSDGNKIGFVEEPASGPKGERCVAANVVDEMPPHSRLPRRA